MTSAIPITEFAPGDRVPIEVVRRQAAAIAEMPLTLELLDSVLNYVLILNPQRQIVFASRNWQELTKGKTCEELLGLRPGEAIGCIHAHDREAGCGTSVFCQECGAVKAVLASLAGKRDLEECHLTRFLNHHEEALDLLVYGNPFQVQGETYCLVAVTDISHEKRRRALERVFFHDVLNSAGGLAALVEMLRESTTEETQEDMRVLQEGLEDLMEQVQTQKDLAAAENSELVVKPEPVNAVTILQDVVRLYQKNAVTRDRRLCLAPDPVSVEIVSDPTLLKRALGNLIKNALEAAKPGQTVTAGCEEAGEGVRFRVHNPGSMPQEVQLQVFSRSFSTKGLGRGLGTYSVRLLTEQYLKGQVGFTSSAGKGTTFFIALPKKIL